jgi:hypothetical protein
VKKKKTLSSRGSSPAIETPPEFSILEKSRYLDKIASQEIQRRSGTSKRKFGLHRTPVKNEEEPQSIHRRKG